jgi:hypothetical protein
MLIKTKEECIVSIYIRVESLVNVEYFINKKIHKII